jgi:biotin carboxylase
VEHPVTEMIYSVDLIEEQIRVALGKKLRYTQVLVQNRSMSIRGSFTCGEIKKITKIAIDLTCLVIQNPWSFS